MANNELLNQVMTHINDHPKTHDQGIWIYKPEKYNPNNIDNCGTAGCFAGWACLLSGNKDVWDVEGKAIEVLGLSYDDASVLFWGDNKRENMELMVKDIQNGIPLRDAWEVLDTESGGYNPDGYVRKEDHNGQ